MARAPAQHPLERQQGVGAQGGEVLVVVLLRSVFAAVQSGGERRGALCLVEEAVRLLFLLLCRG